MNLKPRFDTDITSDKLIKDRLIYRYLFYVYLVLEVVFIIMGGYSFYTVFDAIAGLTESTLMTLLLLLCSMNVMSMFMVFVVWFCGESSYYKMLEQHNDLLLYLRKKMGD